MSGPRCRRAYHGEAESPHHLKLYTYTAVSDDSCLTLTFAGVPRILEGTLPPHLSGTDEKDDGWEPFGEYLKSTRININVRQVFPRGYTPPPSV